MKKLWEKPEMVVLVRRNSDEVILANCKEYGGSAINYDGLCRYSANTNVCRG